MLIEPNSHLYAYIITRDFGFAPNPFHATKLLAPGVESGIGNGVLTTELPGRNPGFRFAENTDDLFVGKTLLHARHRTVPLPGQSPALTQHMF